MWDRGFSDDYDAEKADRGTVLLKERKEGDGYEGVLDVPLASLVILILFNFITRFHTDIADVTARSGRACQPWRDFRRRGHCCIAPTSTVFRSIRCIRVAKPTARSLVLVRVRARCW
jgi:hypothetical protein